MAVTISSPSQITLELFERVARCGEAVAIPVITNFHRADAARAATAAHRDASFGEPSPTG